MGAAVHIPEALYQDTKELPRPRSALVLPAALYPLLVVVLPFLTMGAVFDLHWGWWAGGFGLALAWALAVGVISKSPKPFASARRLLGWGLLWCLEPIVVLAVLGPIAGISYLTYVALGAYLLGALGLGYWLWKHYRGKL
ncbi:hypothetical protein ABZ345_09945 [Lentzea sp. NPDC005914]|uniref:hypothetical protein n=1 Tax=Lentzea sp. NPDC005914 TaxID=3154572 RepID=UPI0033C924FA